jgi:sec-independent protein translocase protein TatC
MYRLSEFHDPTAANWFSYSIAVHLLRDAELYLLPHGESIIALGPWDAFSAVMLTGALVAAMVTIPYVTFVLFHWMLTGTAKEAPALRPKEVRLLRTLGPMALGLFLGGCGVALLVLPYLYGFAYQIQAPAGVSGTVSINEFMGQTAFFVLALGVSFEIPIIAYGLGYAGILTTTLMRRNGWYVFAACTILSFSISPGVGGGLIEIPMALGFMGLYGLGYAMVRRVERARGSPRPGGTTA